MEISEGSTSVESLPSLLENNEDLEPSQKKIKIEVFADNRDKLESRLIGVLSCVVCFDLPNGAIYQVLLIKFSNLTGTILSFFFIKI